MNEISKYYFERRKEKYSEIVFLNSERFFDRQ